MAATTIILLIVGLLLLSHVLWALLLRLGLWWAKVEGVTLGRIVLATLLVALMLGAANVLLVWLSSSSGVLAILSAPAALAACVLVPAATIGLVFRTSFARSLLAWLPTNLSAVVMLALMFLVVRPFLFEAFLIPTNAMAPTILGEHCKLKCPQCGATAYHSADALQHGGYDGPIEIICDNFHLSQIPLAPREEFPGDRIVVAKYQRPQRWDLAVFQVPDNPSQNYVKRVVGLPGETIVIKEGAVWADGKKLTPPNELKGLQYVTELQHISKPAWGSEEQPAILGDGEYFVLGDFTTASYDARFWEAGAPGHPPYAVPEENMLGVVVQTYWPLHRMRSFD